MPSAITAIIIVLSIGILIAHALDAFRSECDEAVPAIRKFKKRIERLNDWWGANMLGDVHGEACRA
jgi:hypothetical protein